MPEASTLVDTDRYPVEDLTHPVTTGVVDEERRVLAATRVSILPGFLRPDAVTALVDESDRLAPLAHHSVVEGTPYLELPADHWPADHPRKALVHNSLSAVAYDLFPDDSLLRALYEWDPFLEFLAGILGRSPLYRYADPLGGLNLAVMTEGDELGWHFDQTDFVVSIAIQSSDDGGDFENVEQLRSADDERYEDVRRVLDGLAPDRIETVPMTPGTLMLFEGRHSMHRVTPIKGGRPRYVGLLGYDTKPDTYSSELLKLVRYGRAA